MLIQSIEFMCEKHKGQKRMGGKAYSTHPLAVASILEKKGFDEDFIKAGLFHDLFEDTDATDEEVLYYSTPPVLHSVKLLTKVKGLKMAVYIKQIKTDYRAWMVKLADRLHNLRSSLVAKEKFRIRYIKETEDYYIDLAKGTVFEEDIRVALQQVKDSINTLT